MNTVSLSVESRTDLGKKATKALRGAGRIPSVIYSKNGVKHFSTTMKDVKGLVYTPDFKLADIQLEGGSHRAFIKSIDFHPVTDDIQHIDFQELIDGQTIRTSLPLRLRGVSPGVLNGGKMIKSLRTIKVEAAPEKLVDELIVDISSLKLGDSVRVRDIDNVEGVTITVDGAIPVVSVIVPRALKEEDDEEGEVTEEGAEGEGAAEEGAE